MENIHGTDAFSFGDFGLRDTLLKAIGEMGFTAPTPIQQHLIPPALAGRDVLGQAQTGTGKTAAFVLPILQRIEPRKAVQAIILVPTRELAQQVTDECRSLAQFEPVRAMAVYGGTRMRRQIEALRKTPQIIVATPGRFKDQMRRGNIRLDEVRFVVLDEVDRMLDIGFRDEINDILSTVRHEHQTIFVSATISEEIEYLAGEYARNAERVFLSPDELTVESTEQFIVVVEHTSKMTSLLKLLAAEKPTLAIVFTGTKREAGLLAAGLKNNGLDAREIHGDMFQDKRDKVMNRFRDGRLHILVATDLASRGIDVDNISHIINYDIPADAEVYVHRIGRTSRMGAPGRAITLVTPAEAEQLSSIEKLIGQTLPVLAVAGVEQVERPRTAAEHAALNRFERPVFGDQTTPIHRTLGGKFPPARGRRRP